MKIAIKKKVLFDFLKQNLSENRTFDNINGSFNSNFMDDEDLPINANPLVDTSSIEEDNNIEFKLTDPEYIPSSISELQKTVKKMIEYVPNEQAKISNFYRKLHELFDAVIYDEDSETDEETINESINISKKTTFRDYNLLIESSFDDEESEESEDIDPSVFDDREPEYGELGFTFEDGQKTVLNFDGHSIEEAIKDIKEFRRIELSKFSQETSREELINIDADVEENVLSGFEVGKKAAGIYTEEINSDNIGSHLQKMVNLYLRKIERPVARKIARLRANKLFQVGVRLGALDEIDTIQTAGQYTDEELDARMADVASSALVDDDSPLDLPTEKELADSKERKRANVRDNKELYDKVAKSDKGRLIDEATHIITSTFYLIMSDLAREDNDRYMRLTAFDGWKNPEEYADSFPLHKDYEIGFFKKILSHTDQQNFIFNVRDDVQAAKDKFKDFINDILFKHFFKLNKGAADLKRLSKIALELKEKNIPLVSDEEKQEITTESLINEIVAGMANEMYKNASEMGMRDPNTGYIDKDKFLKKYVSQVFGASRQNKETVKKYNEYFLGKNSINREMLRYREITFFNIMDESDIEPLTEILLERIYSIAKDSSDPEKMTIRILRVTMDPERPNYSEDLDVTAEEIATYVEQHFELLAKAAKEVQDEKIRQIERKREVKKLSSQLSPEELKALKKKEKEKKKKTFQGLGQYLEQKSASGGRQEFLRAPNFKYVFSGAPSDASERSSFDVGFDYDSKRWLLIDFIDSVYDMATPLLIKNLDETITSMMQNPNVGEEFKSTGFVKKSSNITAMSLLSAAKQDLIKINKIILRDGYGSIDSNDELFKLMYTLAGSILREFTNNIINEVMKDFIVDLNAQVAARLKKTLPKVSFVNADAFSNDDFDDLAEYFIGLKNRPTRLDFAENRRNVRRWTGLGLDYTAFESLYQVIYNSEVADSILGFYQSTIPVFDEEVNAVVGYEYDEDDTPDIYPEKAQKIVEKLKSSDKEFKDAVRTAIANYQNYEKTRSELGDDPLQPEGI